MDHLLKENLVTTKNASELYGYTSDYLARLVRSGEIAGEKIGHSWLVDTVSLEIFLNKQKDRKTSRSRELATSRVKEYRDHNKLAHRIHIPRVLTTKVLVPQLGLEYIPLRSHLFALSVAAIVVAFGALGANASVVPQVASRVATVAQETAFGFGETFGTLPAHIAAKVDEAHAAMHASAVRVARVSDSDLYAVPLLAELDTTSLHKVFVKDYQASRVASVSVTKSFRLSDEASSATSTMTLDDLYAPTLRAYEFITTPSSIVHSFEYAYVNLGTTAYSGITGSLSLYRALIDQAGAKSFAFATVARDQLVIAPQTVAGVAAAVGRGVVAATHAAIQADVSVAYGFARVPVFATGAYLKVIEAPSILAPALAQAVFDTEYAGAVRFVTFARGISLNYLAFIEITGNVAYTSTTGALALTRAAGHFLVYAPSSIEDAYLGALGKSALAISQVGTHLNSALHTSSLAAVVVAVPNVLSVPERIALFAYETIHSLFDSAVSSAQRVLAYLFGSNSNIATTQNPPSRILYFATSTPPSGVQQGIPVTSPVSSSPIAVTNNTYPTYNSYPTYTTTGKGASEDFVNQSLASLRSSILASMSSMVQPIIIQGATNANTIQQVNMIQSLSDLTVHNGSFLGGTFDNGRITNGISIASAIGTFDSLTGTNITFTSLSGGATSLAATTVTGTLAASDVISAPYFTATSTTATSTFAGGFNVGSGALSYDATGYYGTPMVTIGKTTPASFGINVLDTGGFRIDRYGSAFGPEIRFGSALGTIAAPATTTAGTDIGTIGFESWNGTNGFTTGATIGAVANDNASSANSSAYLHFDTTPSGSTSLVERMRITSAGKVGIGTTTPDAMLSILQTANGLPLISAYRFTDAAPSGDFINFKTHSGIPLFRVDNSGNLLAGGIINSGSQTITSTSTPQFRVQYDPSNEWTASTNTTGATTFGVNGTTPSLTFTPGSNAVNTFNFTNALAANSILSIDTLNQRVGIGTTSPLAKLDILNTLGGTTPLFSIASSTNGAATSTAFYVANNGNIGIGTATPAFKLNVVGTGNIVAVDGATDRIYMSNNTPGVVTIAGRTLPGGGITDMLFESSATNQLYLKSNGNVGIGTTSPTSLLEISGSAAGTTLATFTGGTTLGIGNRSTTDNTFSTLAFRSQDLTNGSASSTAQIAGVATSHTAGAISGDLAFLTQNAGTLSEKMRILANGNVGIGTTSPLTKLSIQGTAGANDVLNIASSTGASMLYVNRSGNVGIGTASPNKILDILNTQNAPTWVQITNASSGAAAQAGFVAFNDVANSAGSLTIYSSTNGGVVGGANKVILDSNANTAGLMLNSEGASNPITFQTNNLEKMRITGGGNVGIGTTSPASQLQVGTRSTAPQTNNSTIAAFGGSSVGGTSYDLTLHNNAVATVGNESALTFTLAPAFSATGQISNILTNVTNAASDMRFLTFTGTTLSEAMRIQSTGNVGIGTTSPFAKLSLAGAAGGATNLFAISTSTAGFATTTALTVDQNGNLSLLNGANLTVAGLTASSAIYTDASKNLTSAVPTSGQLGYWTRSGTNLYNTNQGDNVGIGTTSPSLPLSVTSSSGNSAYFAGAVGIGTNSMSGRALNIAAANASIGLTSTTGTNPAYGAFSNASGNFIFGLNGSTNAFGPGFLPNAAVMYQDNAQALQLGAGNGPNLTILNSGKVGIGTVAPAYKLDVNGDVNVAAGSAYKYNGTNVITASTTLSNYFFAGAGNLTMTGNVNTASGLNALSSNTTGARNTVSGVSALANNTTGGYNTASGVNTLYSNTTGTYNTVSGNQSLYSNITGSNNTASGYQVLNYNQSATSSTAIGYNAAMGTAAYSNQGGTYLGYAAGYSAATGSDYNTLLGYQSGYGVTSGARNTLIGPSTIAASYNQVTTGSNNIAIGNDVAVASPTASNQLNIGNLIYGTGLTSTGLSAPAGNVGIGTVAPGASLDIQSTATPQLILRQPATGNGGARLNLVAVSGAGTRRTWQLGTDLNTAGDFNINYSSTEGGSPTNTALNINASGVAYFNNNVGIGTTTPWRTLSVNGSSDLGINALAGYFTATSTTATSTFAGFIDVNGTGTNATSTFASNLWVKGTLRTGTGSMYMNDTGISSSDGNISISRTGPSYFANGFTTGPTTNLGVGTSSPYSLLSVSNSVTTPANTPLFTISSTTGGTATSTLMTVLANGNVGIGTVNPVQKLDVAGFINTDQYSGYRINNSLLAYASSTNQNTIFGLGAGGQNATTSATIGGNTAVGYKSLNALTTGTYNNAMGVQAMGTGIVTGSDNNAFGRYTLQNATSATYNNAMGYNAMGAGVVTGSYNNAFGAQALYNTTASYYNNAIGYAAMGNGVVTGSNNNALGQNSLFNATSASYNNAIGMNALLNATSASFNNAIGYSAMGDGIVTGADNNAFGQGALLNATSAAKNNAIGYYAMGTGVVTGSDNNAIGRNALLNATSASGNIAIGYNVASNLTTGSNNILLGYNISATSSTMTNGLNIGNLIFATGMDGTGTTLSTGNVGIGTTTPGTLLSIGGDGTGINFVDGVAATSTISGNLYVKGTLRATTSYVGDLVFGNNFRFTEGPYTDPIQTLNLKNQFGSTTLTVADNGNVGIGTTTPNHTLTVAGDVGAIAFVNTSTKALKTDIEYTTASSTDQMLNQLVNLKVATYHYKIEDQNDPLRLGFIAEDAQIIAPEILSPDGKGVDLYKLATFTLAGVQSLAAKVNEQGIRIASLEERVAKMESGAVSVASGSPITFGTTSLASAFEGFGVLIQKGIAQFNTLVFRQLVASKDADGTSSAGSVTIITGNTVAQVNNSLVLPTTKVFVTFNTQVTGSWWVSDKAAGSFRVVLSAPQPGDVSFDYFLVQTEGQIATSTPDGSLGSFASKSGVSQSSGPDTVLPVLTLLGDNPVHLSVGGTFVEPGVTVTDNADGTDPYLTFINGVQQEVSSLTIDSSAPTTDIITYTATDRAGNMATAHRSVIVGNPDGTVSMGAASGASGGSGSTDTTKPVVTLGGAAAINLSVGDTFTDPGATATDDVDGNLTSKIKETGTVDTATLGLYTLTYSATDAAGNTGSVSRVVSVIAAPVISATPPASGLPQGSPADTSTASSTPAI